MVLLYMLIGFGLGFLTREIIILILTLIEHQKQVGA